MCQFMIQWRIDLQLVASSPSDAVNIRKNYIDRYMRVAHYGHRDFFMFYDSVKFFSVRVQ